MGCIRIHHENSAHIICFLFFFVIIVFVPSQTRDFMESVARSCIPTRPLLEFLCHCHVLTEYAEAVGSSDEQIIKYRGRGAWNQETAARMHIFN